MGVEILIYLVGFVLALFLCGVHASNFDSLPEVVIHALFWPVVGVVFCGILFGDWLRKKQNDKQM